MTLTILTRRLRALFQIFEEEIQEKGNKTKKLGAGRVSAVRF